MIILLLGAGIYVGWNIGANDTANCIGTSVGCGLISFKRAAILIAVFAILGALLQGHHVMRTIGKGIVKGELNFVAVFVVLICSGFFVSLATFFKIPTSTSQAIVGGVVGVGLSVGAKVDFSKFILIVESWVICPFLVMALAYALSHLLGMILRKIRRSSILFQHALGWMVILSGCYVAFSMGANNAGNAVGPIANLGIVHPTILLFFGGASIAAGAITYGKRVADTVGKSIVPLDIPGAFAAQVSSAFGMHLFSILGIPVSTSSAIVGAVVGVGLVRGVRAISGRTIVIILTGWVLTPCLAASSSFLLYRFITMALG
ncbi:MAG: inorganic phosphate transporter [Desulfobacteraceae bacterium]|nr:inorganic phosphate transporter [Desulfobacteraceae bacterium]